MKSKKSLSETDLITERPMTRRSSIASIGATVLGAVALTGVMPTTQAEAQCSDRDPNDPVGRGRYCGGCSDSDPYDPAGRGRRCGGRASGCSDSDPQDPGGNGQRCGRRSCSDADPYDPGGAGRHC